MTFFRLANSDSFPIRLSGMPSASSSVSASGFTVAKGNTAIDVKVAGCLEK